MNDDLESQLDAWGATEAPAPDAAFAERLENDLRSSIYFGGAPAPDAPPRWRRLLARPAVAFGALLVVLSVGTFVLTSGDDATPSVAVETADAARITFADGSTSPAAAGQDLPNGAQIDVATGGSAVVDGVVLGGGDRAIVRDGIVELLPPETPIADPTTTPTPSPTSSPTENTTEGPAPTSRPTSSPTTTPPPVSTAAPTATSPAIDATARPTATPASPTSTPAPSATPPPETATPRPTVTPAAEPTTVAAPEFTIELSVASVDGGRLRLTWTSINPPAELVGWEVIGIVGDREATVAAVRDPAQTDIVLGEPFADAYRIVARSADGVLAESTTVAR